MEKLTATTVDKQVEVYRSLKESYGRRPSMAEFYNAGGTMDTVRREHGQWLKFVGDQGDLSTAEQSCLIAHEGFLLDLELTKTTKSFKLVLLEAMVELEGFSKAPTIAELSEKSFDILQRRRVLLSDLPEQFKKLNKLSTEHIGKWIEYWKRNPIYAWTGGNSSGVPTYFRTRDNQFEFVESVAQPNYDEFVLLISEINNYRYLQYESRLANKGVEFSPGDGITSVGGSNQQQIPFFSDFKIACGHFSSSEHSTENIETKPLPGRYGELSGALNFIAQAKGDSMNGGSNPIRDGDYLLMEAITNSGSKNLTDQTVAIEQKEVIDGDQYLLRRLAAKDLLQKELVAFNPSFPTVTLTSEMTIFARLLRVIEPSDMMLHQNVFKQDASKLFGIEYKEGVWKMPGHVCPKETKDQFFFVTLNKQGIQKDYRYHDRFEDAQSFHWQSQNKTTPESKRGQNVIHHEKNGGKVHLFVRKNSKVRGKAAPFIYCGRLTYKSHSGSAPMDVKFQMETALSEELNSYFAG